MSYIKQGDCLSLLADVADESVDMILADLPYGRTKNKWDSQIPLDPLWEQFKRVIKYNGAIAIFSQMPFTAELVQSNPDMFKYEWIWQKENATGFLNSHFAPMKIHENILIFSKAAAAYVKNKDRAMKYYPQMRTGLGEYTAKSGYLSTCYDQEYQKDYVSKSNGERYPLDVISFQRDKNKFHPTQKPIELCRYLIRTYTDPGDVVLDPCIGAGTTCIAARKEGREYIGFELDEKYYNIAKERL